MTNAYYSITTRHDDATDCTIGHALKSTTGHQDATRQRHSSVSNGIRHGVNVAYESRITPRQAGQPLQKSSPMRGRSALSMATMDGCTLLRSTTTGRELASCKARCSTNTKFSTQGMQTIKLHWRCLTNYLSGRELPHLH